MKLQDALASVSDSYSRRKSLYRFILMREIGRIQKETGIERAKRYANLRITLPLVPGDTLNDTKGECGAS